MVKLFLVEGGIVLSGMTISQTLSVRLTCTQLVRDCYESFLIYSFFYLLVGYLGDAEGELRNVFRTVGLEKWMFPMGKIKYRPSSGWHFLMLCKWLILQYAVLRRESFYISELPSL